ncbi:hypothetical protein AGMMS50212_03540 [Spirochaetia bacterium]|nr:hypothetical protein AGMMS50212_03540 [Spirochaetia bacterium]
MSEILSLEEKKRRILANCNLEDIDEVPFVVEVGPIHIATKEYYENADAEIAFSDDHAAKRTGVYDYGWGNIKTNVGIGIVAAAFGCEYVPNGEADPWARPLIKSEKDLDLIDKLKVPDPVNTPVYKKAWERVDYLQKHSKLPLRIVNMPSPLNTASLICDNTFFLEAMIEYPDEIHCLLQKVTDAIIGYGKEALKRITNLSGISHEFWGVPKEMGIRISDDECTLLSPNNYREFGVKYNGQIGEAFGGVIVHSCGNVSNIAAAMMETPYLKGVDYTIPQVHDWGKVRDAAAGKTALFLRHFYWDHLQDAGANLVEYSKKIVDFFGRKGVFIETSAPTPKEAVELGEALHKALSK